MSNDWSEELLFTSQILQENVPVSPGVYQILQSKDYYCYEGSTRILKIGRSDSDLRGELLNHLRGHTAANLLARVQQRPEIQVTFKYIVRTPDDARRTEKALLREFEEDHWDIPVLNAQRGYRRGEDKHYRI